MDFTHTHNPRGRHGILSSTSSKRLPKTASTWNYFQEISYQPSLNPLRMLHWGSAVNRIKLRVWLKALSFACDLTKVTSFYFITCKWGDGASWGLQGSRQLQKSAHQIKPQPSLPVPRSSTQILFALLSESWLHEDKEQLITVSHWLT